MVTGEFINPRIILTLSALQKFTGRSLARKTAVFPHLTSAIRGTLTSGKCNRLRFHLDITLSIKGVVFNEADVNCREEKTRSQYVRLVKHSRFYIMMENLQANFHGKCHLSINTSA